MWLVILEEALEHQFGNFELFPKFGTELRTANLEAELNHWLIVANLLG